jgi:hypothetical protein
VDVGRYTALTARVRRLTSTAKDRGNVNMAKLTIVSGDGHVAAAVEVYAQ